MEKDKVGKKELTQVLSETLTQYPPTSEQSIKKAFRKVVVDGPLKGGLLYTQWSGIYAPGQSPAQMVKQIIQGKNGNHKLTIRKGGSSKGIGKKAGTETEEKYNKESYTPKPNKSPIDRRHQELKQTQWRLDDSDRLMATARHPDYIEDWNEFISELNKGTTNHQTIKAFLEKLLQKWELKSPIPPHLGKGGGKDWETIFKANQLEAIIELTEKEWPNRLFEILSEEMGKFVFVRLRIDPTRRKKELLKAFSEKIKSWTKNVSKDRKPRKTKYDPWEIYNLIHDDDLNFLQIALKLHGKNFPRGERRPADNVELWPPYKRVKRAYDQALEMIKSRKT